MFFSLDEVYQEPNLDRLRCVDVSTSPTGWAANERHFITFRSEADPSPLWWSQPVEGRAVSFKEWASPDSKIGPKKMTAREVIGFIETASDKIMSSSVKGEPSLLKYQMKVSTRILPESLTIIEFREKNLPPRPKHGRMVSGDD